MTNIDLIGEMGLDMTEIDPMANPNLILENDSVSMK